MNKTVQNVSICCRLRQIVVIQNRSMKRTPPPPGKPPSLLPAKGKRYRVVHVPWHDPVDVKELLWRRHAYMNAIASIRTEFREQMKTGEIESQAEKFAELKEEADREYAEILFENDAENGRIANARKAREQQEDEEERKLMEETVDQHLRDEREELVKKEALVQSFIDSHDNFITYENVYEKIEEALENPVVYEYAIDIDGNMYAGVEPAKYLEREPDKNVKYLYQKTDPSEITDTLVKEQNA